MYSNSKKSSSYYFQKTLNGIIADIPPAEKRSILLILFEHIFSINAADIMANNTLQVSENDDYKLHTFIQRINQYEPVQYILGYAYFKDLKLCVSPHVLIPRPETEELVNIIISENLHSAPEHVLDVGTGSGAIAIALKQYFANSTIHACDVSTEALQTAIANAQNLSMDISFAQIDILQKTLYSYPKFDIIVSNPPYVLESEKINIHSNVLDYEPNIALFVPDSEPLKYYEHILINLAPYMKITTQIYFEINPLTAHLFDDLGIKYRYTTHYYRDINDKIRFVKLKKINRD
ncbi:MAG: peptide chain release factor N(5)-glutamine methyltransferase [Cytophagales bacterium]|nr:peptide chain release factor N(5)-glutamine methyltransferase [Cytophagales bacterium]